MGQMDINPSPHNHSSINADPDMPEDFDDDKEDRPFEPVNMINTGIESTDRLIDGANALDQYKETYIAMDKKFRLNWDA